MKPTGNVGAQGVSWAVFGAECLSAVYDLRWMIILSAILIGADYWWGLRELSEKRKKAKRKVEKEKFKFRFSEAGRRTLNKCVDYLTFLLVGCVTGLAITEPMGICGHTVTAAIGLGFGCAFEISSIIGHVCFVKGVYIKINWKRLIVAVLTLKWKQLADIFNEGIEYISDDEEHHNHHNEMRRGHRGDCTISATYEDDMHHCGDDINEGLNDIENDEN